MKRKDYDSFIAVLTAWVVAPVVGFVFGWAWGELIPPSDRINEGECYSRANVGKSGSVVVRIVEVGDYGVLTLTEDGLLGFIPTTKKSGIHGSQVDCKFYVLYLEAK